MQYEPFPRANWRVAAEFGYGLWGMGGSSESDDAPVDGRALDTAIDHGVNFFDTALAYGDGARASASSRNCCIRTGRSALYVATIQPKNRRWPGVATDAVLADVFPAHHLWEYLHESMANLRVDSVDLLQFHVWEDSWARIRPGKSRSSR